MSTKGNVPPLAFRKFDHRTHLSDFLAANCGKADVQLTDTHYTGKTDTHCWHFAEAVCSGIRRSLSGTAL